MTSQSPTPPPENHDLEDWEIGLVVLLVGDILSTRARQPDLEREDLVQECLLHWWEQRGRYDPDRGASQRTFLRRVVEAKLLDIERGVRSQKRGGGQSPDSLDRPVNDEPDSATLAELLPDSTDIEGEAITEVTLGAALARLTPAQRKLISGLRVGNSMAELSQKLDVPRATLYDELKRIRQVFCDEGLAPHL